MLTFFTTKARFNILSFLLCSQFNILSNYYISILLSKTYIDYKQWVLALQTIFILFIFEK